jgi:hypothetical protein
MRKKRAFGRGHRFLIALMTGAFVCLPGGADAGFFSDLGFGLAGGAIGAASGAPGPATRLGSAFELRFLYEPTGPYRFMAAVGGFDTSHEEGTVSGPGIRLACLRESRSGSSMRPFLGFGIGYFEWDFDSGVFRNSWGSGYSHSYVTGSEALPEADLLLGTRAYAGSHFCVDLEGLVAVATRGYRAGGSLGLSVLF